MIWKGPEITVLLSYTNILSRFLFLADQPFCGGLTPLPQKDFFFFFSLIKAKSVPSLPEDNKEFGYLTAGIEIKGFLSWVKNTKQAPLSA